MSPPIQVALNLQANPGCFVCLRGLASIQMDYTIGPPVHSFFTVKTSVDQDAGIIIQASITEPR